MPTAATLSSRRPSAICREALEKGLGGLGRRLAPLRAENGAVALDDPREDLRAADVDADGALGRHNRRLP